MQRGIQAVLASFARKHKELTKETLIDDQWKGMLDKSGPESALSDVLSFWAQNKDYSVKQETMIELKIQYESLESTLEEGLKQVAMYYDKYGAEEAHLLIFNRKTDIKWEEKIFYQEREYDGVKVGVWGM